MSLYSFLKMQKEILKTSLSVLLWLISFWVMIVNLVVAYDSWVSIVHFSLAVWWIVSYYFFYIYISRNPSSENYIKFLFVVMFLFYVWANLFTRQNILASVNVEFAITGYSYYLIVFVPILLLLRTSWLRTALVFVASIMIITSYKRGPIVILPLMLLVHQFSLTFLNRKWLSFIVKSVFICAFIAGIFAYVDEESDSFLSDRFSEEELEYGSGRNELREQSMESITERSFPELFVGTGSGSSIHFLGTGAHNEWIEFLFSFGIIGVILFGLFCMLIIKRYFALLRARSRYASVYGMAAIFVLMVSVFSGFYFTHSSFYCFAFLGFAEALIAQERSKQKPAEDI